MLGPLLQESTCSRCFATGLNFTKQQDNKVYSMPSRHLLFPSLHARSHMRIHMPFWILHYICMLLGTTKTKQNRSQAGIELLWIGASKKRRTINWKNQTSGAVLLLMRWKSRWEMENYKQNSWAISFLFPLIYCFQINVSFSFWN